MSRSLADQLRAKGIDPARCTVNGKPVETVTTAKSDSMIREGNVIRIVMYATPIGKPRMTRRDRWHKRPATTKYWDWANRLKALVGKLPPADQVTDLSWIAHFEPPTSWPKRHRTAVIGGFHRSKPDRDNVDKAILDTLWPESDSAIASGTLLKLWDWTARLEITITLNTTQDHA